MEHPRGSLLHLIDILAFSIAEGEKDASKSEQMAKAVFSNLRLRCREVAKAVGVDVSRHVGGE